MIAQSDIKAVMSNCDIVGQDRLSLLFFYVCFSRYLDGYLISPWAHYRFPILPQLPVIILHQ